MYLNVLIKDNGEDNVLIIFLLRTKWILLFLMDSCRSNDMYSKLINNIEQRSYFVHRRPSVLLMTLTIMKRADDMFKRKRKLNFVSNLSSIDISHEQKISVDNMQVEKQWQVGGQNATLDFLSSDQVTSHFFCAPSSVFFALYSCSVVHSP
jgi:hypothetical protein